MLTGHFSYVRHCRKGRMLGFVFTAALRGTQDIEHNG